MPEQGATMTKPVTFGLINTFGNPAEWREPWTYRYDAILEQIEWIDRDTVIDGVYVTEHHFYDDGYLPSPMVMCGAIAMLTKRVQIGTNLIQLPLHNAVRLAEDALVVDALSGGRLRLGLGMGYFHQEFSGTGQRLQERVSRTEEGIAILRKAFAGEPFEFHGKRYDFDQIRVTPPPVREGGPEIWMGGFAAPAIERAARLADGFLEFDPGTHRTYFDACDRLGREKSDQRLNVTYWAIIADDPEKAFAEAGDHWLHLLNQYIVRESYAGRTPPLTKPYTDPAAALADGLVMLADGPTAVDVFNADVDKGAIDINLVTMMPGEPIDQVSERLAYLCDHVIPHVKPTSHPAAT
jgi:alkanesulfonate monooxygenase SsuD/methylene tetrahydromethanopterin reductase-like flavin-dependent oxidoreductase (luciferase family)